MMLRSSRRRAGVGGMGGSRGRASHAYTEYVVVDLVVDHPGHPPLVLPGRMPAMAPASNVLPEVKR
jgi:hypothetical protein